MATGSTLKKFNPIDMSEEDVIALATGREKMLATMLEEMKSCVKSKISQHYVLFGPRGIGKSFFIRLLNIHHDKLEEFAECIFIQLPEETDNIRYVADLMDKISNKLEGGYYIDSRPRWDMTEHMWSESKKRLIAALKKIEKEGKQHVFIGIENLQDFIPKLDDIENGRMREFLSDFHQVTLIGSSLRPDLDNDYNKKLFQVFKKIDIEPWKAEDYIEFYQKKASLSLNKEEQQNQLNISENKIKAIAAFTGGSPRLAVILSNLVLDQKIIETAVLLDNIIDDLTAYYQDLIKDIPTKSKALFDMLIRIGENVTQSELAQSFDPPLEQKTIARSFTWLLDNFYVVYKKQAKGNTKNYFVRDRLFVLYYQKRQIFADQLTSFVGVFVEFLTEYFSQKEWREQLSSLDVTHPYCKSILLAYSSFRGLKIKGDSKNEDIRSNIISDIESQYSTNVKIRKLEDYVIDKKIISLMEEAEQKYLDNYLDQAIKCIEKVIALNSNLFEPYFNLGIINDKLGDLKNAILNYEKAIKINPESEDACNNLGVAINNLGDLSEAIKVFERGLKINPISTALNINLANALKEQGDLDKAIILYKKVIKINPSFEVTYNNLGATYFEQEKLKESEYWLIRGLNINSSNIHLSKSLFELLLIQKKWQSITEYDRELPLGIKKSDILGSALGEAINYVKVESFLLIKETLDYIQASHPEWLIGFVISLTMHLYTSGKKEMLETLVDELKSEKNDNPFLAIILQCWEYLQDPENNDIAKLHPDARIVANEIMKFESMEKV